MIQKYKLDKLTGPSGVFAGYVLLIVGIITVYFSLTAIPLILLGGVMTFSFQQSEIDMTEKRYRLTIVLFGFIPVGKWCDFLKTDQIITQKFTGKYSSYSKSNRQLDISQTDYRVMLVQTGVTKKIHLAKFQEEQEAMEVVEKLRGLIAGEGE